MYLGEIVRNILLCLVDAAPKAILFRGKSSTILNTHYGFDSAVMSAVETAWEGDDKVKRPGKPNVTSFDPAALSADVKGRLERVRITTAKLLGFEEVDVSLQDATVCIPFPLDRIRTPKRIADCILGLLVGSP